MKTHGHLFVHNLELNSFCCEIWLDPNTNQIDPLPVQFYLKMDPVPAES